MTVTPHYPVMDLTKHIQVGDETNVTVDPESVLGCEEPLKRFLEPEVCSALFHDLSSDLTAES